MRQLWPYTNGRVIRSNHGTIICLFSGLLFLLAGVSDYILKGNVPTIAYSISSCVLFYGMFIITKSHGNNLIFKPDFLSVVREGYQLNFSIYQPDNHNVKHAIEYATMMFNVASTHKQPVNIYCGHLEPSFYGEVMPELIKEELKGKVRILIENSPSDNRIASSYIEAGIQIKKISEEYKKRNKTPPHFIVSNSAYRIETLSHSKCEGLDKNKTKGLFVFNANKKVIEKLKGKFDEMWENGDRLKLTVEKVH